VYKQRLSFSFAPINCALVHVQRFRKGKDGGRALCLCVSKLMWIRNQMMVFYEEVELSEGAE
jgi:hypothetical protein